MLPSLAHVGAAHEVERAPQRLARDAHEQVALGHARHLRHGVLGIGHVLEHLDRRGEVELVVGEGEVLRAHRAVVEVRPRALLPLRGELGVLEVDAHHSALAQPLRPLVGEHALAAADVEQRARPGALEAFVQRAFEARLQAPRDRVGRVVLVVGVPGRDRVGGELGHRVAAGTRGCSPVLPVALPAAAPVVRSCPVFCAPAGVVVRRGDAQLQLDAAHALEGALGENALAVELIADDPEREQQRRGIEEHGAEDQRLHVAGALALDHVRVGEAQPRQQRRRSHQRRERPEDPQRLVLRVDAEDRDHVAAHVGPHGGEQPRLARLGVRTDRDVVDGHEHLAGLDDRLERVGELGDDLHLDRGLAVVGAKARRGVGHRRLRGLAHDPSPTAAGSS